MTTQTELFQAWNGKWHIFEDVTQIVPPEPISPWNRVAKPERMLCVTGCGLTAFSKTSMTVTDRHDFMGVTQRGWERERIRLCRNCASILQSRYPKP